MNEIKVTEKEIEVMTTIATSEYTELNGAEPDTADETSTWMNMVEIEGNIKGKSLSGVISSLIKKGFICTCGKGDQEIVELTELGFVYYQDSLGKGELGLDIIFEPSEEKEEETIDIITKSVNNYNIDNLKEKKMNKKASKKVDSKAALKRAWRMVRVNGLDKMSAFDLAWRMERGELPKTFKTANQSLRFVNVDVKNTVGALIQQSANAQREGKLMDASNTMISLAKVLEANSLAYVDGAFSDTTDSGLQVIFTTK